MGLSVQQFKKCISQKQNQLCMMNAVSEVLFIFIYLPLKCSYCQGGEATGFETDAEGDYQPAVKGGDWFKLKTFVCSLFVNWFFMECSAGSNNAGGIAGKYEHAAEAFNAPPSIHVKVVRIQMTEEKLDIWCLRLIAASLRVSPSVLSSC
ncbi:hypothetical protein XENOCAPTIV_003686 [Xenoophorus captivus]|uniref:Uncharacterized protein n=1 Tax=Xenoophorus captivus TaxID=1517983 RepID=A0ABV0QPT2_9TELE